MEKTFTPITSDNMYEIDVWNELRLAHSERQSVAPFSSALDLYESNDPHGYLDVLTMQTWVENNFNKFVDHESTFHGAVPALGEGETEEEGVDYWPDNYTWEEFLIKAGLDYEEEDPEDPENDNLITWRRQPTLADAEEGTFLLGKRESDDICGPWIVEDLQKAFSALRYSVSKPYIQASLRRSGSSIFHFNDAAHAISEAEDGYDNGDPIDDDGHPMARSRLSVEDTSTTPTYAQLYRYDQYTYTIFSHTRFRANVDFYMCPQQLHDLDWDTFFHAHGTTLTLEGHFLKMLEDFEVAADDSYPECTVFSGSGIAPGSYPEWPDMPDPGERTQLGFRVTKEDVRAVLKWDFTKTTMPG